MSFSNYLKIKETNDEFINKFKQYLVNKKVYEAFDHMGSRHERTLQSRGFFNSLNKTLKLVFKDERLHLEFSQENFEFYLLLNDERRITFNQLPEGFSAFISIIMDLLIRIDLIQKRKYDFSFQPAGIVLIDEPETHLHLSMQYEILPLLSNLFPKIQFIIATHSPAIISSLKNSIVYDLTSKEEVSDWVLGSSYSELMIKHFGLENEYSPTADQIIFNIQDAVINKNIKKLKKILSENEKFLTPSLRLEIESQIINIQNRNSKND